MGRIGDDDPYFQKKETVEKYSRRPVYATTGDGVKLFFAIAVFFLLVIVLLGLKHIPVETKPFSVPVRIVE